MARHQRDDGPELPVGHAMGMPRWHVAVRSRRELKLQKRGLATATAITRVLRVVVAAILAHDATLALGRHTKGEFIARFGRAVGKLPQASRDECELGTADWASLADLQSTTGNIKRTLAITQRVLRDGKSKYDVP